MKVCNLFKSTNLSQSIDGLSTFLDRDNCQIINKTRDKNERFVLLHLKRESDGGEARAHLRVRDEFKMLAPELLLWAFLNQGIIGLTLNQLDDLETELEVEEVNGQLQLNRELL